MKAGVAGHCDWKAGRPAAMKTGGGGRRGRQAGRGCEGFVNHAKQLLLILKAMGSP